MSWLCSLKITWKSKNAFLAILAAILNIGSNVEKIFLNENDKLAYRCISFVKISTLTHLDQKIFTFKVAIFYKM